jgi:hypothetical protein
MDDVFFERDTELCYLALSPAITSLSTLYAWRNCPFITHIAADEHDQVVSSPSRLNMPQSP